MAKIRGIEEQQEALVKVQNNIKKLQSLKDFLTTDNPSEQYEISFKRFAPAEEAEDENSTKAKKVSVKFHLSDRDALKIVLSEYEEELKKQTNSLASQYNIELSEDEIAIIN